MKILLLLLKVISRFNYLLFIVFLAFISHTLLKGSILSFLVSDFIKYIIYLTGISTIIYYVLLLRRKNDENYLFRKSDYFLIGISLFNLIMMAVFVS